MGECRTKSTSQLSYPAASRVTLCFSELSGTTKRQQWKPLLRSVDKCKNWATPHTLVYNPWKAYWIHSLWRCWLKLPSNWSIVLRPLRAYLAALSCRKMHPRQVRNDEKFGHFSKQKYLETWWEDSGLCQQALKINNDSKLLIYQSQSNHRSMLSNFWNRSD